MAQRVGADCVIEYKVDWGKKWKEGRYTWEPVTNLNHCPDKIEAFLRSGAAAGNKGRGKQRKGSVVADEEGAGED